MKSYITDLTGGGLGLVVRAENHDEFVLLREFLKPFTHNDPDAPSFAILNWGGNYYEENLSFMCGPMRYKKQSWWSRIRAKWAARGKK